MTKPTPTRRCRRPAEEGYVLVAVVFMLAIMVVAMGVAAPKIAKEIQRDRELETMQRGKQYVRAIKLYYHKFGSYPPSVDALVNTNGIRFLRARYLDPTTGKDDWKPIYLGQNKTPLAMGFFGQPLGLPGAPLGGVGSSPDGSSASGANANSFFASGNSGSTTDPNSNSGNSDSGSNPTSGTDPSGQTFGGGGIIGFSPASSKQSILSYKKMDHYNAWEFLYSPLGDQAVPQNPVNQPPLQGGAPGTPPQVPDSPTTVAPQ
jgi:type II secretory pathway pseudopilin PulG